MGKDKTETELWTALEGLDDDLLDPELPESVLDAELKRMGLDPSSLAERGSKLVTELKEKERLSWQVTAAARRAELEARASRTASVVPAHADRTALLARLDELRAKSESVGSAIRMAARKRKPEESTDEELRALLEEMEALRSIDGDESE